MDIQIYGVHESCHGSHAFLGTVLQMQNLRRSSFLEFQQTGQYGGVGPRASSAAVPAKRFSAGLPRYNAIDEAGRWNLVNNETPWYCIISIHRIELHMVVVAQSCGVLHMKER